MDEGMYLAFQGLKKKRHRREIEEDGIKRVVSYLVLLCYLLTVLPNLSTLALGNIDRCLPRETVQEKYCQVV